MRKGRKFLLFSICGLLVSAFSCALFQPKTSKVDAASGTYILVGDHQGGWNNTDDRYAMTHDSTNNQYYFKDICWTEGQQWRITWAGEWGTYAGWSTLQNKDTFEDDFEAGSADNNIKCKRDCYYDIYIKSNNEIYPAYAAYTVTLNKDGGVISSGEDITGYQYGDEKTLPTLQKEGYDFLGWYDNPSFTGQQVLEITALDHGNKTYYAKFGTAQCSLFYELSGGTFISGLPAGIYDYNTPVPEPSVTRNDYKLTGWENGDGETVAFPFNLTKSTELVAKWEPTTFYTITLNTNNANYGTVSPNTLQVPIDSVVLVNDNVIHFNKIQAVATPKAAQELVQYNFVNWTGIESGDLIRSDKTITANFEEVTRKYLLEWDFMGGTATGGTPAGEYNYNTEILAPEDISKTGKYFDGWYFDKEFTDELGISWSDGCGSESTSNKYYALYKYLEDASFSEKRTVYAKYKDNYTVQIKCPSNFYIENYYYTMEYNEEFDYFDVKGFIYKDTEGKEYYIYNKNKSGGFSLDYESDTDRAALKVCPVSYDETTHILEIQNVSGSLNLFNFNMPKEHYDVTIKDENGNIYKPGSYDWDAKSFFNDDWSFDGGTANLEVVYEPKEYTVSYKVFEDYSGSVIKNQKYKYGDSVSTIALTEDLTINATYEYQKFIMNAYERMPCWLRPFCGFPLSS